MSPADTLYATSAKTYTGSIFCIQIESDAIFTTCTGMNGEAITGVTFTAGRRYYGNFSVIKLASGTAILYAASANTTAT